MLFSVQTVLLIKQTTLTKLAHFESDIYQQESLLNTFLVCFNIAFSMSDHDNQPTRKLLFPYIDTGKVVLHCRTERHTLMSSHSVSGPPRPELSESNRIMDSNLSGVYKFVSGMQKIPNNSN